MGNLKSAAGAAGGDYEISELSPAEKAAGWAVDAPKAAVPAGDRKTVVFTLSPPAEQPPSSLVHMRLSEWKEAHVRVSLKGGFPAPKTPPAKTVLLTVRCYLEPLSPEEEAAAAAAEAAAAEAAAGAMAAAGGKAKAKGKKK